MIYADYNGSAPLCKHVREYIIERLSGEVFANPNAIHKLGNKTLMAMENARSIIGKVLGAKPKQIIFNSGATEGISTVFHSVLRENKEKDILIVSGIEHAAIYNNAKMYDKEIVYIDTKNNGVIDLDHLRKLVSEYGDRIAMIIAMAANNETGVIQPFLEIAKLCNQNNIPFFCDTTQYIGKTKFDFNESGIDFAVTSGHKFGAMTGTGILLAKDKTLIKPIIIGGGQEKGLRGGTQNYLGFETIAVALKSFDENIHNIETLDKKRKEFESKIKERFPKVIIMGEDAPRLATTTYLSYPGIHGQAVQIELESQDIFVTTSSACSDNNPTTSRVLKAMGINESAGRGVVRISLCVGSSLDQYDQIFEALVDAYSKLEKVL